MVIGVHSSKNTESWKTAMPEKKKKKKKLPHIFWDHIYCGNILVFKRIRLVVCKQILVTFNGYDSSKDAA